MTSNRRAVPTAIGSPLTLGNDVGAQIKTGQMPMVLQVQPFGFIPLETPEQLQQFEEDLRTFYGITAEAGQLRGRACETCSCGCSDDCGFM
jgi:hypothetical protein